MPCSGACTKFIPTSSINFFNRAAAFFITLYPKLNFHQPTQVKSLSQQVDKQAIKPASQLAIYFSRWLVLRTPRSSLPYYLNTYNKKSAKLSHALLKICILIIKLNFIFSVFFIYNFRINSIITGNFRDPHHAVFSQLFSLYVVIIIFIYSHGEFFLILHIWQNCTSNKFSKIIVIITKSQYKTSPSKLKYLII